MRSGNTAVRVITAVAILLSGCLLLFRLRSEGLWFTPPAPGPALAAAGLFCIFVAAALWSRPPGSPSGLLLGVSVFGTELLLLIITGVALEALRPKAPGEQLM